jgi:hypothetical protein
VLQSGAGYPSPQQSGSFLPSSSSGQGHTVASESLQYDQPSIPEANTPIHPHPTKQQRRARQKQSSSRSKPVNQGAQGTPDKPYICPVDQCGKSYDNPTSLQQHRKRHQLNFRCAMCEHRFAQQRDLDRHWKSAHSSVQTSFPCEYPGCDTRFTRDDNVGRHWKDKHGVRRPKRSDRTE